MFVMVLVPLLTLLVGLGLIMTDNARAADDVVKWKCVTHWPMASSSYKGSLEVIAERIKERTNGRLIIEPRRLWKRYIIGTPLFFWRLFLHHILKIPLPN